MMFDYARNGYLNTVLNAAAFPNVITQIALLTTLPEPDGPITEPSGGGYAKVITSTADWSTPDNGFCYNVNTLTFPQATADWGTIVGIAITTTDNNLLFYGPLRSTRSVSASSPKLSFPAGSIRLTVSGCAGTIVLNGVLDGWMKSSNPAAPLTFYLGLSQVMPSNDGTGWTEPTIGSDGYDRAVITNAAAWSNPITVGFGYNVETIRMPATGSPSGDWLSSLAAWGLWDAAEGGNLYFFGKLQSAIVVNDTSPPLVFTPGQIQIGLDSACC
ncbi:hypothetical protein C4577_07530 [Candidatus Parcubacteria bacterium]|nr:MAG: hypothetical protein C4577_07530 [Candidatus Parcubacteria bacterium]